MLAISMTVSNRPHYLKKTLKALKLVSGIKHYHIYIACEPSCDRSFAICKSFLHPNLYVHQHKEVQGINNNFFYLHNWVFNRGSYSGVLYVEEDVLLGYDACDLANWYIKNDWSDKTLSLNLCNYFNQPGSRLEELQQQRSFNGIGLCFTKKQWDRYLKPCYSSIALKNRTGWDNRIRDFMLSNPELTTLTALQSRATHFGDYGQNCTPEINKMLFKNICVNQKQPTMPYRCIDEINRSEEFLTMNEIEAL